MEIYITCFLEILSSSSRCRRFETENFFRRATMVDNNMSKLVAPPPRNFFVSTGLARDAEHFDEHDDFFKYNNPKEKWKH